MFCQGEWDNAAAPRKGREKGRIAVAETPVAIIPNTRFEDIGSEVVNNTKKRILDMIGHAIAGAKCDGNSELARLVEVGRRK